MILKTEGNNNLKDRIAALKKEMNAVILAHFYQEADIQDIADHIGDSLELARKAKATDAEVIVFCGVHFMSETAKILNPDKLVLLPDPNAGCSLADSAPAEKFAAFRKEHPELTAITYINCSAEVKALSDLICTSSNAEKLIRQIPEDQGILFAPDKNLGRYLSKQTGRDMVLWDGSCEVHVLFSKRKLMDLKLSHPTAKILAHPECEEAVLELADFIGSTSKLLEYTAKEDTDTFIIATESGILHQMEKRHPRKKFIPAPPEENCPCNNCPHMRLNTLQKVYDCMVNRSPAIEMPEDLRLRALKPLEKMLQMS